MPEWILRGERVGDDHLNPDRQHQGGKWVRALSTHPSADPLPISATCILPQRLTAISTLALIAEACSGPRELLGQRAHHGEDYLTREQARASIFEYIETWYNRVRRHSKLGYLSPVDFEASQPQ